MTPDDERPFTGQERARFRERERAAERRAWLFKIIKDSGGWIVAGIAGIASIWDSIRSFFKSLVN